MLGDREGALALYRQAIETEPDPGEAALRAAALLRQAGRGKEALDAAERGLARGSRRATLWAVAGDLAREAGDAPRAMVHYIRALQAAPELSEVWHALARTAFSAPGLVTDQAELKTLAGRAGNVPAAHLVVGLLELTSGRLAAAQASLRKAREMDAADPDIAYFLGVAHLESGDLAAADAVLEPLAASRQDLFQVQRALGLVREKQGRRQEAVTLLRRALVLKPEDPVSRDALARLGAPP
jgi:tetratricopeptide (TPR) repeat protein